MTHYMRDEYGTSGGGFTMGLLTGAAIGAGVALLFAPREGAQMRHELADGAQRLGHRLTDNYGTVAGTVRDSARRVMDRGKDAVDRGKDAYRDAAAEVRSGVDRAVQEGRDMGAQVTSDPFNRPHMG